MKTSNALSVDSISAQRKSTFARADSLTLHEKRELLSLLNSSYPDLRMNRIFEAYPCTKQLYVFRLWIDDVLIASRQMLVTNSFGNAPMWAEEMAYALSIKRFAIGSRAIVHADFRNRGLGRELVRWVNHQTYTRHGLDTIFGSSTSIAAIALYLRLGARLWNHDINKLHLRDAITLHEAVRGKLPSNNHRERHLRMRYPLHYVYHRHAVNSAWDNYLWSPDLLNTAETRMTA